MFRTHVALLLLLSYIAYSEQGTCDVKDLKRVPAPPIVKTQRNQTNGSLDIRACDEPKSPDIIYTLKPEKITSKTSSLEIELTFMALAYDDGGFVEGSVVLEPGYPPLSFSSGYDCGMLEHDIPCPLPLEKGQWMYVKAICDTRFYMPNMDAKLTMKLLNYDNAVVTCIEGRFRTF